MTILRAAAKHPDKFVAVGFCNLPLQAGSFKNRLKFRFQHLLLPFRQFYVNQVAKVMFAEESRAQHPELATYLRSSMSLLDNREIKQTDKAVITKVDDGYQYLNHFKVPALALKGDKDYVQTLENIKNKNSPTVHIQAL